MECDRVIKPGYWRKKCKETIQEACLVWFESRRVTPGPSMPPDIKEEFYQYLRKWYPFGQRKHFPYKVWLSEMQAVKKWLYAKPLPIQGGLFEDVA